MKNKQIVIGPATLEFLRSVLSIGEYSQERIDAGSCPTDVVARARTIANANRRLNLLEALNADGMVELPE